MAGEKALDISKLRPAVVALIGVPGSGKAHVAQALAEQLGMRRVNREAIRDAMFPRCAYSFAEKRAAFRALLLALEINCLLGESSVIDGVSFRADAICNVSTAQSGATGFCRSRYSSTARSKPHARASRSNSK